MLAGSAEAGIENNLRRFAKRAAQKLRCAPTEIALLPRLAKSLCAVRRSDVSRDRASIGIDQRRASETIGLGRKIKPSGHNMPPI